MDHQATKARHGLRHDILTIYQQNMMLQAALINLNNLAIHAYCQSAPKVALALKASTIMACSRNDMDAPLIPDHDSRSQWLLHRLSMAPQLVSCTHAACKAQLSQGCLDIQGVRNCCTICLHPDQPLCGL